MADAYDRGDEVGAEVDLPMPLSISSQSVFNHAAPVEEQHAVSQDAITTLKRTLVVRLFIASISIAQCCAWLARIGRDRK